MEPPTWIIEHYAWAPSKNSPYWCDTVGAEALDYGLLAALARHSFLSRGVQARPAQLIRYYSEEETQQWRTRWINAKCAVDWIRGPYVYQEAVAAIHENLVHVWNAVENSWVDPHCRLAFASTVAIRITAEDGAGDGLLRWGPYELQSNTWQGAVAPLGGNLLSVPFPADALEE
jgi:hypothetical protein